MKQRSLQLGLAAALFLVTSGAIGAQQAPGATPAPPPPPPTLGLDQGVMEFDTPDFKLKLVKASQTIAALEPKGVATYTPTPTPPVVTPTPTPAWQDLPTEVRTTLTGLMTRLILEHTRISSAALRTETGHDH